MDSTLTQPEAFQAACQTMAGRLLPLAVADKTGNAALVTEVLLDLGQLAVSLQESIYAIEDCVNEGTDPECDLSMDLHAGAHSGLLTALTKIIGLLTEGYDS